MKKLFILMFVLLSFSLIFSEEIIFDGSLTLKYSVDLSPNLTVNARNNFLYVGIKGDAYFVGFLSQDPTSFRFSIDQAYGIFDLGFANLFLGPKVQNFKVSDSAGDLWLGGTISADIPFSLGNIYVAIDPVFNDTVSPKVNVLSSNLSIYPFNIRAVVYNNFSVLESGIDFTFDKYKFMVYGKFDLLTPDITKLTIGGFTSINKLDLTLSVTPDIVNFNGIKADAKLLYNINKDYQFGTDFSYNTSNSNTLVKIYSIYSYKDLTVSPSLVWNSSSVNQLSGSLEVNFNF